MENGPPSLGLEDGTIDVERLLVEPQDGHVSMDSVICFNEKIPVNAMDNDDVSLSFGGSDTGIAHEQEDILNGEVLDAMPSEVDVGYFKLHDHFCSMREEYLLGVEFAESITNLDYGSTEGMPASEPNSQMQASSTGSDTTCNSDLFIVMEEPDCNYQFNFESPELSDTLKDISKSRKSASASFQGILSDENDGGLPSAEMCPRTKTNDESQLTGQDGETNIFQESVATMSVQTHSTDDHPTKKRSRKPTQRYIDELTGPISTYSKKRREVPSNIKDKSNGIKHHKKCSMGSKEITLPVEEPSVIAIQVPFGSLADGHACDLEHNADIRSLMTKLKGKCVTQENKKKVDECSPKKMNNHAADLIKRDDCATPNLVKRTARTTAVYQKTKNEWAVDNIPKKRDDRPTSMNQNKRDDDDPLPAENPEEVRGRRKHHRLWTISEVRKLIDGVSQYGVGRWSRIKKLFFSTSSHRTSVDLKDKWRNLLKASGIVVQENQQGEKKRNVAWRPLPKSILRRVCELNTMYPYRKGERSQIAHLQPVTPDRSYRRIIRKY